MSNNIITLPGNIYIDQVEGISEKEEVIATALNELDRRIKSIKSFETSTNKVTSLSSSSTDTEYPSAKCVYDAIQNSNGITSSTVTSSATMSISPDVVTVIDGDVGTAAITLQVPNDNRAHVWDILMTTGASPAVTLAMSNSETILAPSGFSIGASKDIEISVIGVGTKYYLRYGEFA